MLPGLSSTYCIFDGGVHTDIIASIVPKGAQEGNRQGKANGKNANTGTKKWKKRDERKKGNTGSARICILSVGSTAVSADVAPPKGMEQAIQRTKTKTKTKGSRSSLRLRRQVMPTCRAGALLPCLPTPS